MDNHFGGVIWTNHALDRMRERGISQSDAWATWSRPDQSRKGRLHQHDDAWRYYKRYGDEIIEVVARKNEKGEWIILTVWSRPVDKQGAAAHATHHKSAGKSLLRRIFELLFVKKENWK